MNDGVVSNIAVAGTNLNVTGANGGFNGNLDLEPLVDAAASNNGYLLAEVDGDITNEIQILSLAGADLSLSNGGGTVSIPGGGTTELADQVTIDGDGTLGNEFEIADGGVTAAKISF